MNRRDAQAAVLLLGAVPPASPAQAPKKVWRFGCIVLSGTGAARQFAAFKEGLRKLGYVEDKDYVLELRSAQTQVDRMPALAAELVRLGMDLILVGSDPAPPHGHLQLHGRHRAQAPGVAA